MSGIKFEKFRDSNNINSRMGEVKEGKKSNPFKNSLKKAKILEEKRKEEAIEREKLKREKKMKVKERYDKKRALLKKTKKGQPVLSRRINFMLAKLQKAGN